MTAIAVWREEDGLWACGDSRISDPGRGGGVKILTDAGAKIFEISVTCHKRYVKYLGFPPTFQASFGFAFAGSALVATMTVATANTVFREIVSDADAPPLLSTIAEMLRRIAQRYVWDLCASQGRVAGAILDAAFFGYCPVGKEYEVYRLRGEVAAEGRPAVLMHRHSAAPGESPLILGSGGVRLKALLVAARSESSGSDWLTHPDHALMEIIAEDCGDVGGSLSVARIAEHQFRTYWTINQKLGAPPERCFNGLNLDTDLGVVEGFSIEGVGSTL